MSSKQETNKVIVLVIVGIILAWAVGSFMGGFMGNIYFALVMIVVIFSGVFGQKTLTSVGGIGGLFTIGIIIGTNSWGRWWQYLICYLIAIFIGNALSNFRPNWKQERLEFDNELNYDLFIKDCNFATKFPKKPKLIGDGDVRTYRYDYASGTNSLTFSVSVARIIKPKNEEEIYEDLGYAMGTLQGDGHEIHSDDESKMLGAPCYTGIFENPDGSIFYRKVFIKDTYRYVLTFGATQANETLFNKFVDSFRFIKA